MISEGRRRHFHDELDTLQARLLEMAGIVEGIVRVAMEGLADRDGSVVAAVIQDDDRVDELEIEIDERALELLALQQPMARDLRQIVSTLKVSNDLERVGDHGVNIAKAARRLSELAAMPAVPEIEEMAHIARGMLADALAAFVTRNSGTARMVCVRDDRVDNLRRSLYRILLTHMLEEPRRISPALELLLVSQNLERIADLSTNIAEDVVFLVEGRTIKHHAEERGPGDTDEGRAAPGA
ncbi:MAG TPA: phosphate signaling complex protein PhoU [Longimicrobiales bacterium]|nr:phosphate signaling complex protein PhoU [Longimicrobiales bacterium]